MADDGFAEFVRHRSGPLLRTAYLLCAGDRGAAEDLLQDVLERMYPRWRRVRGSPEAYARAALANAAANRWRLRARRVAEAPLSPDVPAPTMDGPEDAIGRRDPLLRALAELPPRQRATVVLRYFDDLSEADTAAALGCHVGTVKSQTARALARLRELLAEGTGTAELPRAAEPAARAAEPAARAAEPAARAAEPAARAAEPAARAAEPAANGRGLQ